VDAGYLYCLEHGRRVPSVIVAEVLIDSFVRAARQGIALAGEDLAWLDWVEVHVTESDPLLNPLAPPDPPEATPQNLKPFLVGVNSHGPGDISESLSWAGSGLGNYMGSGGYAIRPCSRRCGLGRSPAGPSRR
jgi:hypothetical protein